MEVYGPDGTRECQDVVLAPGRLVPVCMFGRYLGGVSGAYRATWASVLAPPPAGVRLELGAGAGTCLDAQGLVTLTENDLEQIQVGLVHNQRNTCITGLLDTEIATALLTVTFPEPVRSLVAVLQAGRGTLDDHLDIEWRLDDGGWSTIFVPPATEEAPPRSVEGIGRLPILGVHAIQIDGLPAPGARQLEIRFRMCPRQRPADTTSVRVLHAYVNELGFGRADAAFAIVADPDPSVRRRR